MIVLTYFDWVVVNKEMIESLYTQKVISLGNIPNACSTVRDLYSDYLENLEATALFNGIVDVLEPNKFII